MKRISRQTWLAATAATALGSLAFAQDAPDEGEPPEEAAAGMAVSTTAQGFADLDPDAVEGPGLSARARELRGIALANLPAEADIPEEALAGPEAAPETAGELPGPAEGDLPEEAGRRAGDDEDEDDREEDDAGATGLAVSEAAQELEELDPDEVEGPGLSQAAQDLRGIALDNLPEEARAGRAAAAGPPDAVGGRPGDVGDVPERPGVPERPQTPDRPEPPERPERPEPPERPDVPDRPGGPGG